jgi:diguanylate cyclase (GGDEF)-like protein/PAS domain S-box-containing protein
MKLPCQFRLFICVYLLLCSFFLWAEPLAQPHPSLFKHATVVFLLIISIIYWNVSLQGVIQKSKQLELALRNNEARLHAIINACPVPLALNDAKNITFINPEFTKRFGYTLDDIPTLADWWPKAYPDPEYRLWVTDAWLAAMDKAKREHDYFEPLELNICCKNGTTRTIMISAALLADNFSDTHLVILYDVTNRKTSENALQQSIELLQSVIDNIAVRVFWKDKESRYLGCNNIFARDAGFTHAEQLLGKDDTVVGWKDQAERYRADDVKVMNSNTPQLSFEEQQTTPDGNTIWLHTSKVPLHDNAGQVMGMLGIYDDITERKHNEESLQLAASVFANSQEGIVITDTAGRIIDANQSFTDITGYERTEILGNSLKMLKSGRHDRSFYKTMWKSIKQKGYWRGEIWNRRKNGDIYPEWLTISTATNAQGDVIRYIGNFSDISLLKQREQQLEHITHYDLLTGLPNRLLLLDRMNLAIAQSKRNQRLMAVCYLDLDGFGVVNDNFSHAMGDKLLIEITKRIKKTLREEDTLARIGGDEFIFLLQDLEYVEDCEHTLHRLLSAISVPVILQNQTTATITASIGISIFPDDNCPPEILIRHADQAMYQAKQEGKNAFRIYDIALNQQLHKHRIALNRIEQAFENNEFELYFQPKVDMQKGIVFGAEALIRWQQPERGLVTPNEFLPLLEHNDLARRLDAWVINQALQHAEQWHTQGLDIKISVNISARTLQSADFFTELCNAFVHHPLANRHHFELEILETEVLHDLEKTAGIIKDCQALGVSFALDDFGTGYSSLSYLRHLPIQTLKIDQSFVRDMLEDDNDLTIVRSIIGLAQSFNRHVIAEGVESVKHGSALLAMGCHQAQGYAIAKPMPAADFAVWLQNWEMPNEWKKFNENVTD